MVSYATPIRKLISEADIPLDFLASPDGALAPVLDKLFFTNYALIQSPDGFGVAIELVVAGEAALSLPGLDGFAFVVGGDGEGATLIDASLFASARGISVRLDNVTVALRFPPSILKPVPETPGGTLPPYAQIEVNGSVVFDENGDLRFEGFDALTLKPVMIGNSGVIISAEDVKLDFSRTATIPEIAAAGFDESFMGVFIGEAKVQLPEGLPDAAPEDLVLRNCAIGTGGVTGKIEFHYTPTYDATTKTFSGRGSGTLFGVPFAMGDVILDIRQNAFRESQITGSLVLPYFEERVDVELGFNLGGGFTARLTAESGLVTLSNPGILNLTVDSLGFRFDAGLFTTTIGGRIQPDVAGLDWPTFEVKELAIDSHGNVRLEGGWLDLPEQYSLDFYGFQLEITKLGFGKTDDGGKWIGFSGGLKLVDELSAGASVEGLRVTWYEDGRPVAMTLNGVDVEFEVPDVIRFKGTIAYRELPGDVHRFDGSIKLELLTLDLEVDAVLVVGTAPGYTFMAIYLSMDLPAGVPLWSSGLALYGMAGLFALNMKPDKAPADPWYEIGGTTDWYHRSPAGVTDLQHKWANELDALAFGAGVTIGTIADNGFTFSGRVLLVITFPGPVLLLQGAANLLKERSKLSEEPIFRALAVLDSRAGTFLIGLDAQYKHGSGGELIDIHGGVEAFYNLSDADAWHVYLGLKDPREKRIRAEIFHLFEANTYLMLDSHQLAIGAWIGYDKRWSFGPLSVTVEAWIEGNAVLSRKPVHFYGDLWLHGKAELKVFGFGAGLSVDARFAAEAFDPYHILAEFSVGINLPWPLPDFDADITLEWGPTPANPPLPLPLKEIAVEHFKVTTSWPLPRGGAQPLLLPNFDNDADGFLQAPVPSVAVQEAAPPPAGAPVVPLDARPHITFGRSVRDPALIGVNAQPVVPEWERIGDPAKNEGPVQVKYSVTEVALHKYDGSAWQLVSRKATTANPPGVPNLYGSWAPIPAMPDGGGTNAGQVKLWLWSKTPFDYTRHTSQAWDEWFTDRFEDYPCVVIPPDREICCDFERIDPAQQFPSPWYCPDNRKFRIAWLAPALQSVTVLPAPVAGLSHALCFPVAVPGIFTHVVSNVVTIYPPEPAKKVRILLTGGEMRPEKGCADFRGFPEGAGPNPRVEQELTFLTRTAAGNPETATKISRVETTTGELAGLECGFGLEITFPCAASVVWVTLTHFAESAKVEAFNQEGSSTGTAQMQNPQGQTETLELRGNGITRFVIHPPNNKTFLHEVCYLCPAVSPVEAQAIGFDADGQSFGPYFPQDGVIDVVGGEMIDVHVHGPRGFCIVQVCVTIGPDPAEVTLREEMLEHLREELARWSQTGAVLEPDTRYRLKVVTSVETTDAPIGDFEQTEFAYFRTEGPPGLATLSVPSGAPNPNEFQSGLNDLTRYVRQTIPATVPAPGEKPPLPRPVYRGYDVGLAFNEDYVDLMYRLHGRDLGLYLYDSNNQPVRDVLGRLIVLTNRWGRTEDLSLTESEKLWITVINGSNCASLDTTVIPHSTTLSAADGQVLDPDIVYEARLVPLLLHEAFAGYTLGTIAAGPSGRLGRWVVRDDGGNDGPSQWQVGEEGTPPSRFIIQTRNTWGGTVLGTDPVKPGTFLLYDESPTLPATDPAQPGNWTDYRLSVYVRSADNDAIGVVFRYQDANNYYRFSMDRERGYRRLVRVAGGITTVLAEDDAVYLQDQDYLITVEAIDPSLRVYQDGVPVFSVTDSSIDRGRIGLYCWANQGARFSDVRVDDFRAAAPVVYRFKFTTSRFVDFFHHLHSYQDEVWRFTLPNTVDIAPDVAQAMTPGVPLADAERRAFDSLAAHVLGPDSTKNPPEVQVTQVEQGGNVLALLIQSSEPIDWTRTRIELSQASRWAPTSEPPRAVKLTDVTFGSTQPNQESVTLLLREPTDLTGYRIEHRHLPGPLAEPAGDPVLFTDDFGGRDSGLLFQEKFGPNALDHYTIVDEGNQLGPSAWAAVSGQIVQTSNIYSGSISGEVPDKPGTLALTGSAAWDNVRIRAGIRSDADDAIGVVFRYQDADNYYRFSMDRERRYRRLIKKFRGTVSVLWEDAATYNLSQSYRLEIVAAGDQLLGYLDDVLLYSLSDADIRTGRVGFYCWANSGARFEALAIESVEPPIVLWQPTLSTFDELEIVNEPGTVDGPSEWVMADGILTQTSNIHAVDATPNQPGTYALGGSMVWRDVKISVRLGSDTGQAIGVMFRYQDADNYYRFSMDSAAGYRRLIKKAGGVVLVLWEDSVPYTIGQGYELMLRVIDGNLTGILEGVTLFSVHDEDLKSGRVGLYCSANPGTRFERVLVVDATRSVGPWLVQDQGTVAGPSVWRRLGGSLMQLAGISGGVAPKYPGTMATAGGRDWEDYRLSVRLRSDTDRAIGILFRYQDADNYYRLSMDRSLGYRRLIKRVAGTITTLWEDTGSYAVGKDFTLTVDAVGSRLTGYLNDTHLFSVNDDDLTSGQVGLYAWSNAGARFERVEVERPPLEAFALLRDRFSIGDTSGWTFIDEGTSSGPSNWTTFEGALRQTSNIYTPPDDRDTLDKPGTQAVAGDPNWTDILVSARLRSLDDDAIGLFFRYQDATHYYRFSMDRQRGYRRLVKNVGGTFTLLWEDAIAYDTDRAYELTVIAIGSTLRGFLDGVPLFVVEDADLATGSIGLYCWANTDARFSDVRVYPAYQAFQTWLLNDPFYVLATGRWQFIDEGDQDGPSQWAVAAGELQQTSNIHGGDPDPAAIEKPGTLATAGNLNWADYRLSVRLLSDTDQGIGVVFRYQDADNYYRFSMDRARGFRRLTKTVAGVVSTLWEDTVPYTVGREYIFTVDCLDQRLTGYLDGVELFNLDDPSLAAGQIGLYCWANTGARFQEVRVAAPRWTTFYRFRSEQLSPAGTRVHVFAGSASDAPPTEAGVIQRFAASHDERGRIRLSAVNGADLRLVAPGISGGHSRRFLPESAYSAVAARLLRKADGTGFVLLVPDTNPPGSLLAVGQYRLKLSYLRDNRAAAPESLVYSQAGHSEPETVTIDIPVVVP